MSLLLETIRLDNGIPFLLSLHQERVNRSRKELLGRSDLISLEDHINPPPEYRTGVVKCRILYGAGVDKVEFSRYSLRSVRSLCLVQGENITYSYKYADRSGLNNLFAQRGNCDDILVLKDGLITDTSYANVVFFDGVRWLTPDKPLLEGVRRRFYLEQGIIFTARITAGDLPDFSELRLINAMITLEESPSIPIRSIFPAGSKA